jgi:O-antigen/teichoic acid export membrane protein
LKDKIKDSIFFTLANILTPFASFLILPFYTANLDVKEIGLFYSMNTLYVFLIVILGSFFEKSLVRYYFDFNENIKSFYSSIFYFMIGYVSITVTILLLSENLVSQIFPSIEFHPYYFITILSASFFFIGIIPRVHMLMNKKSKTYVLIILITILINITLSIYSIVVLEKGALGLIEAMFYTNICMGLFYFIWIIKYLGLKTDLKTINTILKFGLPFIPALIAAWVLNMSDRAMIDRYLGLEEVGVYSLGYKFGSIFIMASSGVMLIFNPLYYKTAKSLSKNEYYKYIYILKNNIIKFGLFILISQLIFLEEAIIIFAGPQYIDSVIISQFCAISCFVSFIGGFMNYYFYQENNSLLISGLVICTAIFNVVLNIFFIPIFGIMGAIIVTLLSFIVSFILIISLKNKTSYFVNYNWLSIFKDMLIYFPFFLVSNYLVDIGSIKTDLLIKLIIWLLFASLFFVRNKKYIYELFYK